jgi:hypothetical protein
MHLIQAHKYNVIADSIDISIFYERRRQFPGAICKALLDEVPELCRLMDRDELSHNHEEF